MARAMIVASGLVAAIALSWWLTDVVRRYAIRRSILDVPNERSSHTTPTPRGGGIAIVVTTLLGIVVLGAVGLLPARVVVGVAGGAFAVALTGWIDDRRPLAASTRALIHFGAAVWLFVFVGRLTQLRFGAEVVHLGIAGDVIGVLGVVWLINLYNFMDGIDGIAGSEAVAVAGAGALLLARNGAPELALIGAIIAASAIGFLGHNWPPARIFMGDVGSGFLGFILAALAVLSEQSGAVPLWIWVVLLAVFVFDATATLIRRMVRGEHWHVAHRRHAYQRIVQAGWSHRRTTLAVIALDIVLAVLAWIGMEHAPAGPFIAAGALLLVLQCYIAVERIQPMKRLPGSPGDI